MLKITMERNLSLVIESSNLHSLISQRLVPSRLTHPRRGSVPSSSRMPPTPAKFSGKILLRARLPRFCRLAAYRDRPQLELSEPALCNCPVGCRGL